MSVQDPDGAFRRYTYEDIAGTYSAATSGGALVTGSKQVLTLTNEKGAVLQVRGSQVGLEFNLDLSGMAIGLR